jgi:hypothetical protein
MLKVPVTIFLILLITLQTFSKWCLIVEYQVNRDFIARNLCINRVNRERVSCCQGKCYLDKKMAHDESSQQAPGKGGQKEETVLQIHHEGNALPQPRIRITLITHSTRHLSGQSQEYLFAFFPPPKSSSPSFLIA